VTVADHTGNAITGGIFFSAVVQGRDITVVLPPQITPAMAGLPAASAAFTGRTGDLDAVLDVLAPHPPSGAAPRGRSGAGDGGRGMGGIGKPNLGI
jgi:hypothetical protein